MTLWTSARLLTYLLTLAATGLALMGYAAFDGTIVDIGPIFGLDLPPFNVAEVSGFISSGLATLAVVLGWGKK